MTRLSKAYLSILANMYGHHLDGPVEQNPLRSQQNKKAEEGWILPLFLTWDTHVFLPLDIGTSGFQTFGLPGLYQQPFSAPHTHPQAFGLRLNYTTSSPILQLAYSRYKVSLASVTMGANPYNQYPLI